MSNTREIATRILVDIYQKNEFFETISARNKEFNRLEPRDKAFVRLIIFNTLRRNGQIQKVIYELIKKPLKKNKSFILNLIRISICQILYLDLKEYSVVNSAVELSKPFKLDKFVNGLLRNICRNKSKIKMMVLNQSNIPKWIKNNVKKNLGQNILREIESIIIKEPLTDIKLKRNITKEKDWKKIFNGEYLADDLIRINPDGPIEKKPMYNQGIWWVQGISATVPVSLIFQLYKELDLQKIKILDVGAAPGGKTFQLLDLGFDVSSLEISERRIKRLKENLARLNLKAKIIHKDFLTFDCNEFYDCVLLDSPCSASGLMQKKPEILVLDKKDTFENLIIKQTKMLEHSIQFIKKGGYIVYCTCSIHSRENIDIIESFLSKNLNFKLVSFHNEFCKFGLMIKEGMLMILPTDRKIKGGIDGFFISILQKVND